MKIHGCQCVELKKEAERNEKITRFRNYEPTDAEFNEAMQELINKINELSEIEKVQIEMVIAQKKTEAGIHPMEWKAVCNAYLKYIVGY